MDHANFMKMRITVGKLATLELAMNGK